MDPKRFDPDKLGPRSRPAYDFLMADAGTWSGEWLRWYDVVGTMLKVSDLEPASCTNILKGMVAKGICETRGTWSRREDTRELRFVEEESDDDEDPNYAYFLARGMFSEKTP